MEAAVTVSYSRTSNDKRNMGKETLRRAARWLPFVALLLLQGCAVVTAPGFDFADPKLRTSVTLGQYVPADPDHPPQGVVTPITPTLVRAQHLGQPDSVPATVRQLFAEPKPYTIGPSDIISVVVYDHPELQPLGGQIITQVTDPTGITARPASSWTKAATSSIPTRAG